MDCCMSQVPATLPGLAEVERAAIERGRLLLIGPPGIGATMLVRRVPTILPPLAGADLEAVRTNFLSIDPTRGDVRTRPMRAPHFTCSAQALSGTPARPEKRDRTDRERRAGIGAARPARAGEVALAHAGVLFLDDVSEFSVLALEALRAVLRAGQSHGFAARPDVVIATALPCPCGWYGSSERTCVCPAAAVARHTGRVDKAAMMLGITARACSGSVTLAALRSDETPRAEPSDIIRARVSAAREARS